MAAEALLTTRQVEIIGNERFAILTLDTNNEIFVLHIATLAKLTIMLIYSSCKTQIALLTSIKIPTKYSNFLNVFSSGSAVELPEHT